MYYVCCMYYVMRAYESRGNIYILVFSLIYLIYCYMYYVLYLSYGKCNHSLNKLLICAIIICYCLEYLP